MNEIYLKKLLDDFFSGNDTARLCADAGMALGCPILLKAKGFAFFAKDDENESKNPVLDAAKH